MSEIDFLFEKARSLSDEELLRFLRGLTDAQCREVQERLASTIVPDGTGDGMGTIDAGANEPITKPRFVPRSNRQQKADRVVPSSVGVYKILQQIGEGGMGQVYLAEQQEPVKRRVALKVINTDTPSDRILARFEAERQALAMMDHQNIAKVLDAGMTEDGRPYFAMELVKGIPITDYCDQNRLTPDERLELFVQTCRAIQHAHQKGIIHRDLKPSNVLVTLYDGKPTAKVIDFGLAKAVHDQMQLTNKTLFTQYGQVVGTLEYMSPEQAELNTLDVDTRTDVYSLGVILYELLTGSTPIGRERLRSEAFDRILALIREEEAPRPSTRLSASGDAASGISDQRKTAPKKLSLMLKGELDWIAMKSLEKDRTRRYDGASSLADDVERFLQGEPIEAHPPTISYRFNKTFKKHKTGFIAAATGVGLLLAGLLGTWTMWSRAETETKRAIIAEREANDMTEVAKDAAQKAKDAAHEALAEAERANNAEQVASAEAEKARESERKALNAKLEVEAERDRVNQQKKIAENKQFLSDALADQWRFRLMQQAIAASDHTGAIRHYQHDRIEFPDRYLARSAVQNEINCHRAFRDGHWEFVAASINKNRDRLVAADAGGLISVWTIPEGRLLGRLTRGLWVEKDVKKEGKIEYPGQHWIHYTMRDRGYDVAESELYSSVCWTTNPQRVVAITDTGRCIVLDPEEFAINETKVESELLKVEGALTTVSSSADETTLAIGSAEGRVYLGGVDSSIEEFVSLDVSDAPISCIRSLGSQKWLVGSTNGVLSIIDQTPAVIHSLALSDSIWDISTSREDGAWNVLVTTDSPQLTSISYSEAEGIRFGRNLICAANSDTPFNGAQFTASRNEIWAVDANGYLYVWDRDGHGARVGSMFTRSRLLWSELPTSILHRSVAGIFDMADAGVFTLGGGGTVRSWQRDQVGSNKIANTLRTVVGANPRATFTPDKPRELWIIDERGKLSLLDTASDQLMDAADAHQPQSSSGIVIDITTLSDGRVATVAQDSTAKLWKAKGGKIQLESTFQASRPLMSVAVSENAGFVAAVDTSSHLHVWNLDSQEKLHMLPLHPGSNESMPLTGRVSFNRDGNWLAAFGSGQESIIYDTETWKPLNRDLQAARKGGLDVVWSAVEPDLVVQSDTQPSLVPIQIGNRLGDLESIVHNDGVGTENIVDINKLPGRLGFISVSESGTIAFHSATHFVKTFEFATGIEGCTSITLSSDNRQLIVSTRDGSLHVVSAENFDDGTSLDDIVLVEAQLQPILAAEDGYKWVASDRLVRQGDGTYAIAIACGKGSSQETGELLFAQQTNNEWALETIYPGATKPVDIHGVSMIEAEGPVVAFRRRTDGSYGGDLLLARRGEEGWRTETVASSHNDGHYPLICTNAAGEINSVLHYDHGIRGLKVSVKTDDNTSGWLTQTILPTWGVNLRGVIHDGVAHISYGSHRHNNDGRLRARATWDGKKLTTLAPSNESIDEVLPDGRYYNVTNSGRGRRIAISEAGERKTIVDVPPEALFYQRLVVDSTGALFAIGWDETHQHIQLGRYSNEAWAYFKLPTQGEYSLLRDAIPVEPNRLLLVLEGTGTLAVADVDLRDQ